MKIIAVIALLASSNALIIKGTTTGKKLETPAVSKPKFALPTISLAKKETAVPAKGGATKKVAKASTLPSLPSPPTIPSLPSPPSLGGLTDGGPVGIAGKGMSLLSIPFSLEAKFQAAVLGFFGEIIGSPFRFNSEDVRLDLEREISKNKAVVFTYGWSPFSTGALDILDDYAGVKVIELGPEWFFLLPTEAETRVALGERTGSTALPKLFVNKEYQGGFSTDGPNGGGILALKKSGELDRLLKKKPIKKAGKK